MVADRRSGSWGRWHQGLSAAALAVVAAIGLGGCNEPNSMLRQQGINALEANDVPRADNRFSKAIEQDDTDWKALYYVGEVRLKQDRPLDAQIALERALTLRPRGVGDETSKILDALAEAIFRQNHAAQLTAMLQKATDDYGTSHDYIRQGKYLAKVGDVDGGKTAFRKAVKMAAEDDPTPYLEMADFYESAGDNQSAIQSLKYAYYILPRSPRIEARFRKYGIVPGPTVAVKPPRD